MISSDFKFDFKVETIVNREDDTSFSRISNSFKGIACNTSDDPNTLDCSNTDMRISFIYDGDHYTYRVYSAQHPFCPAIVRGMNPAPKNPIEFTLAENIFESHARLILSDFDGLIFMVDNSDFSYLESIGCFECINEMEE